MARNGGHNTYGLLRIHLEEGMMLKTPTEWLQQPEYTALTVLDPDGWDRKNFDASWAEPITELEFNVRCANSTLIIDRTRTKH